MQRNAQIQYSKPSLQWTGKGDRMSFIANLFYNWVKGYSQKCTIGYIANTHDKHKHKKWLHIGFYIRIIFCFKYFTNYKTFLVLYDL
jgi:hypothetical protein